MKRVLFKVILPLLVIAVWMNMCYWICVDGNGVNWFQFWIMSGFPFGIRKMLMLLIPRNFGIAGSIGVLALDAIIGGVIGVVVLANKNSCDHQRGNQYHTGIRKRIVPLVKYRADMRL